MKIARYRSKRTFEAVQWNGSNHDQIAEFLGPHHYGILVREESSQFKAPRLLAIDVGWGTIYVREGDYVTRDDAGHVSHNSQNTFLTYFEEQA